MATKKQIEMNFRQAKEQAKKLEDLAERLRALGTKKVPDTMQNISAGWKGENAALYLKKGEQLGTNIKKTASDLKTVANDIRTTAEKIYRAELEAIRIAQTRTYTSGGGGIR